MKDLKALHPQLIEEFLSYKSNFTADEKKTIKKIALFSDNAHGDQKRKSGEPYIIHPLKVSQTLIDIGMDMPSVCAGLLHDIIEDTSYSFDDIKSLFGEEIATLVDGVTKISNIDVSSKTEQEAQTIRKMFFAMSKDPRVIIIKLADKLHNMTTLQFLNQNRAREIAFECLDVYAPLADRLGINTLKTRLEDEAFKVIKPQAYKQIEAYIEDQVGASGEFLKEVEHMVKRLLGDHKITDIKIESRIKHIYSIYQKMRRRTRELSEIKDIYGMRIICNSVVECYTILGLVHSLFTPVDGQFKDYIAMPKANDYQSLHTTVVVNWNKKATQLEMQIRTYEMDAVANFGVASHWAYKAETGREKSLIAWKKVDDKERYLKMINRMKNWQDEIKNSDNFMEDITNNLLKETIVVFTPKGKAIELPQGATALDFAYIIHTDIGNHTQLSKVNGVAVPLSEPLKNTDIVEIITSANAHPKENWLRYAVTQSARRKIKAYLNKHDSSIIFAKNLIVKNLNQNQGLKEHRLEKKEVHEKGDIKKEVKGSNDTSTLLVDDGKNIMLSFAKCCHPVKGDPIIGYVSRGRGVIVHKKSCPNLPNMTEIKDRLISVSWDNNRPSGIYKFAVVSKVINDLFGEIESAVKKYGGILLEGKIDDDNGVTLSGTFTLEIPSGISFKMMMKSLNSINRIEKIEKRG